MIKRLRHIFSRLWHLVLEAPETWTAIAHEETDERQLRKQYTYTLIALSVIVSFLGTWILKDIQHAIAISLRDTIVLLSGYFVACWLCRTVIDRLFPKRFNLEDCDKTVCYCYAYIIIMQTFISIIPHSYYLYLINLFVAYLLWEAGNAVFALDEEERQSMVIYFTLIIVVTPIILTILLNLLVLKNIL